MDQVNDLIARYESAIEFMQRKVMQQFKADIDRHEFGLTGPQFFLLHLLQELEPCKSTVLADKMEVKPSAITVMIDRLEQAGFVSRHPDEHDRRVVLVRMTERGRSTLNQLNLLRREHLRQSLSALTPEEMGTFVALFEKMAAAYYKKE